MLMYSHIHTQKGKAVSEGQRNIRDHLGYTSAGWSYCDANVKVAQMFHEFPRRQSGFFLTAEAKSTNTDSDVA